MTQKNIAVLIGSNRRASYSRKLAQALMELASAGLSLSPVAMDHLPFYNQDLEDAGDQPQSWLDFRQQIKASDGLLFITPEYNRGVPALLKNAVDVGSRPYGQSVWNGKRAAVISISQGPLAGFGANHQLRQALVTLNVATMGQPEAYIGNIATLFDGEDKLVPNTRDFMAKFMTAFEAWVNQGSH